MKKICCLTLMLLVGLLSACTQVDAEKTPTPSISAETTPTPSISVKGTPTPVLEPSTPPYITLDDEAWRAQMTRYVEDFPEYQYRGETEATFGDRHFLLEEHPENSAEELVALHYYYDIAGEFDKLAAQSDESESLTISANNLEKQFAEGDYMREYIVKSLATLEESQVEELVTGVSSSSSGIRSFLGEDLAEFDLVEWTLVRTEFSLAHSQASLDQGPQLEDGDYTWSYLCGKSAEDAPWKIFALYWE